MFRLIQPGQRYVDRNGAAVTILTTNARSIKFQWGGAAVTILTTNARSIKFQWGGAQDPVQTSYGKFMHSFEVLTEQDSEKLRLGIGITYPEVTHPHHERLYAAESA